MNLIFAGFGGQGVLTGGLIIGKTGVDEGKNVTWIPSYGSEMRGGTANCNLKISDKKISSPFIKEIDILLAMNVPSIAKFEPMVKPGGMIIANTTMISDYTYRDDVKIVEIDATAIANEVGDARGANIVMLGALAASGVLFDEKVLGEGMERFFTEKGKNNPRNKDCFKRGHDESKVIK